MSIASRHERRKGSLNDLARRSCRGRLLHRLRRRWSFALSGDLPTGSLSMPGSGFLPKILAGLTDRVRYRAGRAGARKPGRSPSSNGATSNTPALVVAITAAGIAVFDWLGFLITMVVLMFALLIVIERRNVLYAAHLQRGRGPPHLCDLRLRAEDAARHRPVRILATWTWNTTLLSLLHGFSVAFEPSNLWYAFLGCLVGTLVGVLPGIGPLVGHLDPSAGDVRAQRHAGRSSCSPASITARNTAARPPRS